MVQAKRQRNTVQRMVILEVLRMARSHPTAGEVYDLVRRRLPKISLGTVYRNLELLSQSGAIQKLQVAGAEARFDGDTTRHHHVRCVGCGRVGDVLGLPAGMVCDNPSEAGGYEILGYRLEFLGVCPTCRGRGTKGPVLGVYDARQ